MQAPLQQHWPRSKLAHGLSDQGQAFLWCLAKRSGGEILDKRTRVRAPSDALRKKSEAKGKKE
jgi:hypothetical protein